MAWTEAQQKAIESRGSNLLVSAAAGSGKTAVLAERIVSLVKEGTMIDQLLVVTFTKAAAAEMRARIMNALQEAAGGGDMRLAEQAMRVERADISTLHGFCASICRDYFQAAAVDPTFRIADSAETALLRTQAMVEALTECYESESYAFSLAADAMSQDELIRTVDALHHFLMARPDPWQWLMDAVAAHDVNVDTLRKSIWMEVLLQDIAMRAGRAVHAYDHLVSYAAQCGLFETFAQDERAMAVSFREAAKEGIDALAEYGSLSFTQKPRKRKDMDQEAADHFAVLRDHAKGLLKAAAELYEELGDIGTRAEDEVNIGLQAAGLQEAVRTFHERFASMKRERNVLDFNDLEHCAYLALQDEDVAAAVRDKYAYIFIDEYQDSSLLQDALLECICKAGNLFMVGDVKQSIYRFRQADPTLFLQKLRQYDDDPGAKNRRIALNANFRSTPVLLDAINQVFDQVFTGGEMELLYAREDRLIPGGEGRAGVPAELHLFVRESGAEEDEADAATMVELSGQAKDSIRQEAEIIGDRIMDIQEQSGGAVRLRDMAVLMRTVRGKAAMVVEVLRARGIMAWSDIGEDALARVEVQAMVSLLQVIDNIHQDIPLMAALRGPALGLSEDAISMIRIAAPEGMFASAVLAYAEREDALAEALRAFVERIRGWALDAQVTPLDCLLRQIYNETGHYAQAGAKPDGGIRQANLRTLAEHAGQYQRAQGGGLGGFLRYLQKVKAHEGIAAHEMGERDDVVRVMSIHKSKGLQFPVVFVAGLGRRFSRLDQRRPLQLHSVLGIGMPYVDAHLRTKRKTLSQMAIQVKRQQEALAEEARILYVAMTRAQERLVLVGVPAKGDRERWAQLDWRGEAPYAKSMMDWIVPYIVQKPAWIKVEHEQVAQGTMLSETAKVRRVHQLALSLPAPRDGSEAVRALVWQHERSGDIAVKRSVSSVVAAENKAGEEDRFLQAMSQQAKRPLFMEKKGLTAAEKGDAVHAFLRAVPLDVQDLDEARRIMVNKGLLSAEQARSINLRQVAGIISGPVWGRMRAAKRLWREKPFILRENAMDSTTLLQGVIDCCFMEDDQWVILDYKSDRVKDAESLLMRYKPQLEMYATAMEQITGIPVKERLLYLLDVNVAYAI